MVTQRYGKPDPAAGIVVYENGSVNQIADPLYGTCIGFGPLQRGPMGALIPIRNLRQYLNLYGDPSNRNWHLYPDGEHLFPDFIDDYFANSGGAGTLFICRLDLDGKARKAELVLKNRLGADALKITAANEGRWAGVANKIAQTPVVVATPRTFTLVAPGVLANEFLGADAEFTGVPNKKYRIVANTAANPASGEVVFTTGSQHNLVLNGVSGPAILTGTASYTTRTNLAGTIEFPLYTNLSGSVSINGVVITGVGTEFLSALEVGRNVYFNGEARAVLSITSDTTLTISEVFSTEGNGVRLQTDNLEIIGTTTQFTTDLAVGDKLYVTIDSNPQARTIAAITSDTSLILTSGYTEAVTAGSIAQRDNLLIAGVDTQFTSELAVGTYIVDPNRSGSTIKVVEILSPISVKVEKPFSQNFTNAQLTKQSQLGKITLDASRNTGLAVEVGQGQRLPDTHFSLRVFFNGSLVLEVPDCSLDPADRLFVERVVDQENLAYTVNEVDYHQWIRAESLWLSDYTTDPVTDVRPCNGSGTILELTRSRLYTVADLEYDFLIGNQIYPNPYEYPRSYFRVQVAVAPKDLAGTISSNSVTVTGTSTTFLTDLRTGDYLYDPGSKSVRKIRTLNSNTSLTLETAFPTNIPALTKTKRAGYLQVNEAYDLQVQASVGDRFLVVHPQPLTRGYDGNLGQMLPYYYTKFADPDLGHVSKALANKNLGLARMFTPGVSDEVIQKAFANLASLLPAEYRYEIPSHIRTASAAESFVLNELGRSDYVIVAFPSYGYKSNPLGAGYRYVSLSGSQAGGESRRSLANRGYHYIYSGTQAILPGFLRLPFSAEPADEAILHAAGIQPVLKMDGNVVNWGDLAPSLTETYRSNHVRRIQTHLTRIFMEARNLMEVLYVPNQPGVADQIILMLEQLAREEYNKGIFTRYLSFRQAVEVSTEVESNSILTEEDATSSIVRILNGRLQINFFYVPTGLIRLLEINTGPQVLVSNYGQFSDR